MLIGAMLTRWKAARYADLTAGMTEVSARRIRNQWIILLVLDQEREQVRHGRGPNFAQCVVVETFVEADHALDMSIADEAVGVVASQTGADGSCHMQIGFE